MEKNYNIEDRAFDIGALAAEAMLYEVSAFPSPGLVSPVSSGAHEDMDFFTFIDSTSALIKYLIFCANEGFKEDNLKNLFNKIREIGKNAEKDMFSKTKGINTHKGMLFLMGTCSSAAAFTIKKNKDINYIKFAIREMTKGIVNLELGNIDKNKENLSHGERLFIKHNIKGVRGEVEEGIPIVFNYSLSLYEKSKELSQNHRLINTLIGIMQYCEDTTIVHRHSLETLLEVQNRAKKIMSLGGMLSLEGKKEIIKLNEEFTRKKISPGGSADLLAITVFLYKLKEKFKLK